MALIELKIGDRVARALERIADAIEHIFPSKNLPLTTKPAQPEDMLTFDPEAEWQREQEEQRRKELGLPSAR